jgi:hypothetical protein
MTTMMNLLSVGLILTSIITLIAGFIGEFTSLKIGLIIVSLAIGLAIQWFVIRPARQVKELRRKYESPMK